MSTTFKKFRKDNIVRTKYTAHKQHEIKIDNFSGSQQGLEKYQVFGYESQHVNAFLKDTETGRILIHDEFLTGSYAGTTYTELETTNGFFKRSIHDSLAHLYYNGSHAINVNLDKSFCVEPTRNEYRELNSSAQVISIPQQLFGDKLQENDVNFDQDNPSLKILSGTIELREDGFGNLYDYNAAGLTNALKTYHSTTGSLVGYWGFNELYKYHQPHVSGHCPSFFVGLKDGSRYQTKTIGQTVFITTGSSTAKHGSSAMFTGQAGNIYDNSKFSYFYAKKHNNIDFRKDEDFAVSMWAHLPPSQSNTDGLFNYILTTGQGYHEDATIESGYQKSKFPFDLVMYNQTAGLTEQATLLFNQRNFAASAAKQLFRIKADVVMTASAETGSIRFSFSNFHNTPASNGGTGNSSSFQFGTTTSDVLTVVITGSSWNGFPSNPNTTSPKVIYVPIGANTPATITNVNNHLIASGAAYPNQLKMINPFGPEYPGGAYSALGLQYSGHLFKSDASTLGSNWDERAGANFVFRPNEHSDFQRFGKITNNHSVNLQQISANPAVLRQPSESVGFVLKDPLGTRVKFSMTSASTATYPTISMHGAITSSMTNFANAIVNGINSSFESGSVNNDVNMGVNLDTGRILRISASHQIHRGGTNTYGREIILTASIAGDFTEFGNGTTGPGHNNMQTITAHSNGDNAFNNYGTGATPEPNDTDANDGFGMSGSPYPDFFTGSFFILSCRPSGSVPTPSENVDEGQHEKHVFYWQSGSSTAPDLGTFQTHSTTVIDLGAPTTFPGVPTSAISGAYDYWNVASRSYEAIYNHPSFSVITTATVNNIVGSGTSTGEYGFGFDKFGTATSHLVGTAEIIVSNSYGQNTVTHSFFPHLGDEDSGVMNSIQLNIRARNQGITPIVISGSQFGPLFSSSALVNPIPSNTSSMTATDGNIGRPGQILARRNDGVNLYQLSSSTLFVDNQTDYHHILFQKTGSNLELYMNNQLEQTLPAQDQGDPKTKDDLYFAVATRMTWSGQYEMTNDGLYRISPGTGNPVRKMAREFMRPISGAMDEIHIFDKALNSEQRQLVYNCPNGTPFVGNVMHEHGLVILTHPSSAYDSMAQYSTASFKNTFEIFENSFTAEVKRGEFNFTMNPSIMDQTAEGKRESKIASFITDTDWDPYITTIGLYDDSARLLAVGKLSRPLRKNDGYDTTIEVRFDT